MASSCQAQIQAQQTPQPSQQPVSLYGKGKVTITPYVAEGSNVAVVVCPGGSYCWLDMETEGTGVAQWLQSNGISAFVLRYRVAGWWAWATHYRCLFRGHQYPDMLHDGEAALRWVRQHSAEFGIDSGRVGVMGFSAGGHLALSQACYGNGHPAFVAAIYPVVSMSDPCTHKRSRRALLGERRQNDLRMRDSLSIERHIPAGCPPVFLLNCLDDPVVDYRNSVLADSALIAQGVNHLYIQYRTGGHGFGASESKGTEESRQWKNFFLNWIKRL
ncbi:MAG: alpha/beta hydrolase [Bacteroidales bacterium]|nr:alpha/beta hydrolase [Bacteroidales bacterium]